MMTSKRYTGKPAVLRRVVKLLRMAMWRHGIVGYEVLLSCGHTVIRKFVPDMARCEACGEKVKAEE